MSYRLPLAILFFGIASLQAGGCGPLPEENVEEGSLAIVPSPPFYGDPANQAVFAIDISHHEGPMAQREMDCFWDSGVRHVIVGTQVEEVARQQLAMAVARGMTVDAYVYLYWTLNMKEQVEEALRRAQGFPIGRMWLDVEEDPRGLGEKEIGDRVQQAIETCQSLTKAVCGIYTGPGFWKSYMNNTNRFASMPLWYAWYNFKTSLDDWKAESFGGWTKPVGKQWAEQPLCGVGVDKDTMKVDWAPTVVVDRSLPPDDGQPPPAPGDLYPAHGTVVGLDYVKLMASTVPHATRYQLALEMWSGKEFRTWYTWTTVEPFRKTFPSQHNAIYRFRARAQNSHGWGDWSPWSVFDFGKVTGPRPDTAAPPAPAPGSPSPGPTAPPSPDGAPGNLAPDGQTVNSETVKLSCAELPGATRYEFSLDYIPKGGSSFVHYVDYTTTSPTKTFTPQVRKTSYRFRVRAEVNKLFGPWSSFATFNVE